MGDRIRIVKEGREYTGILMPSHRFSGQDVITLKLDNGYNIGLGVTSEDVIEVMEKGKQSKRDHGKVAAPDPGKPRISILATGGTIASYVDYRTGAVHPAETAGDLFHSNPELVERCSPSVKVLFSKLSEDIGPRDWVHIADSVIEEFESGAEGVIIAHGTDTMGYTSAALSFLLHDLPGPVVLVGSQRSSDRPSSDASLNLLAAVEVAKSDLSGVYVVMHESLDDNRCSVHFGTKVRKMHTSRRDAFRSVNAEPLGWVDPLRGGIHVMGPPRRDTKPVRVGDMDEKVCMLYVHPGMDSDLISLERDHHGMVLVATGLGHIHSDLIPAVREVIEGGTTVVVTSQCIHGTVNLNVYSSGRMLAETGVISGRDMLPETALVKLMWALTLDDDVNITMNENISGEFSGRRR